MEYDENIIDIRENISHEDLKYQSYSNSKYLISCLEDQNLRIEKLIKEILEICNILDIEHNNDNYPLEHNLKQYYCEKELMSLRSYLKNEYVIDNDMFDQIKRKNWGKVEFGSDVNKYIK